MRKAPWPILLPGLLLACQEAETFSDDEFETTVAALPPAGSNAQNISNNIPTQMNPGERLNVRVVMRNTGISTGGSNVNWDTNNYALYRINTAWTWSYTRVTPTVPACNGGACSGANDATFDFVITAPAANPNATFSGRMRILGDTPFGDTLSVTNINVNAGNQRRWSCGLVSSDIPATMAPGESRTVNVTVQNTGSGTWQGSGLCFYSRDRDLGLPPSNHNKWGGASTCVPVTAPVAPGGNFTFTFPITAPTALGPATIVRQILDSNPVSPSGGVGIFDLTAGCLNQTVTIDNASTPAYDAAVVAQTIPPSVIAGTLNEFRITMRNTGTEPWVGSTFHLRSVNPQTNLWQITAVPLGAAETVAPNATREFVFNARAPITPGLYDSLWQMTQQPGVGQFGDVATTNNITVLVGTCSNGTVEGGEQCDDGNVVNGDGCSASCAVEPRTINLATQTADRGEIGPHSSKKYNNVSIGDVTGDGNPEVVMAGTLHVYPMTGGNRSQAGQVHVFANGAGFFTGANETAPGTASLVVWGADNNDELGGNRDGSAIVGDVTGDGIGDLIMSSRLADGTANGRVDAGEIFVIAGAADLLTAGTIDLRANPLSTRVVAHLVGPAAGDQAMAFGVGDFNNDGNQDLVVGLPGRDGPNGADAGGLMIIAGPLSGDVDLSTATPITVVDGAVAGLRIGVVGAVGDISRDGIDDFVLGVRGFDNGGFTDRGAVCAFFGGGTLPAAINLATDTCNVTWLGEGNFVGYGTSVAIANVVGTADNEVIIGANQIRKGGVQVGAVDIWDRAFFSGLFFDMTGTSPDVRVLGDNPGDQGGQSVAAGDMNGDGYGEIAFVSPSADGPANDQDGNGEVRIILGGASLTGTIDLTGVTSPIIMYGANSRDLMGTYPRSLAFGDINNDGRSDFCIGSHQGGTNGAVVAPGRVDCIQSNW